MRRGRRETGGNGSGRPCVTENYGVGLVFANNPAKKNKIVIRAAHARFVAGGCAYTYIIGFSRGNPAAAAAAKLPEFIIIIIVIFAHATAKEGRNSVSGGGRRRAVYAKTCASYLVRNRPAVNVRRGFPVPRAMLYVCMFARTSSSSSVIVHIMRDSKRCIQCYCARFLCFEYRAGDDRAVYT